jgi:hypothetical protein
VRQPLYKSSVGRWKVYEQQLAGLQQRLAPLIARYEQQLQQQLAARAAGPDDHEPNDQGGAAAREGGGVQSGKKAALQDEELKGSKNAGSKDEL